MRKDSSRRKDRLEQVGRLVRYGFPSAVVAKVVGVSEATINSDRRLLPKTTQNASRIDFKRGFDLYAREVLKGWSHDQTLLRALEERFGIALIPQALDHGVHALQQLCWPKVPTGKEGYVRLLEAVFGRINPLGTTYGKSDADHLWETYLEGVASRTLLSPESREGAIQSLLIMAADSYHSQVMPEWSGRVCELIDLALTDLSNDERLVIRSGYGLDGPPKTLRGIGQEIQRSPERVRQIQAAALRRLRHPTRSGKLHRYIQPAAGSLIRQLDEEASAERAGQRTPVSRYIFGSEDVQVDPLVLLKPTDELELSVRSSNCLRAHEIKLIGDLVQKSQHTMLWYKNFGRKSLLDINRLLEGMGLRFGMSFPENWRQVLERWRDTGEVPIAPS